MTFTVGQRVEVTSPPSSRSFLAGLTGTVVFIEPSGPARVQMDQDVTMHYEGTLGTPNTIFLDPEECTEITT